MAIWRKPSRAALAARVEFSARGHAFAEINARRAAKIAVRQGPSPSVLKTAERYQAKKREGVLKNG